VSEAPFCGAPLQRGVALLASARRATVFHSYAALCLMRTPITRAIVVGTVFAVVPEPCLARLLAIAGMFT